MDEQLRDIIKDKMINGTFGKDDISDYKKLIKEICEENDEIKEECKGKNVSYLFKTKGIGDTWSKIDDGKFSYGNGGIENPTLTFELDEKTLVGMYTGKVDSTSAYRSGDINIIGPLNYALLFRTISEIVQEELGLDDI
ncbi:MAG: SCP2 sterol-binding domain-containing protein [archaeon]|nr:SCP2 sterol-binding domain-containing protein [archaeon]